AMPRTHALLDPEGVWLDQGVIVTPDCCPSRTSIWSGQHTHRTGVLLSWGLQGGAEAWKTTTQSIQVLLKNAGYRTGIYGKYLNGFKRQNVGPAVPPGWSEFHVFYGADDRN